MPWYVPQPMPFRRRITLAWEILTGQYTHVPARGPFNGEITLRMTRGLYERTTGRR